MPADHPFARWARDFGISETTQYQRNRGAMGRLINLQSFFEKISPELSCRLPGNISPNLFTLVTDIGEVTLFCSDQCATVLPQKTQSRAHIAQHDLMVLAMGYKSVDDLVTVNRLRASASVRGILNDLFPLQTSHMWWADRF
jgi:predicted acetyltransferase